MVWVKLTDSEGEDVYFNLDRVDYIERVGDVTRLNYIGEDEDNPAAVKVQETPEQIFGLMLNKGRRFS